VPDHIQIQGRPLLLNGFGQRLYSFMKIPVYVAALYVQHLSTDAQAIIHSSEIKLLTIAFQHDVSAADARDAWREGFDDNCRAPCRLDPGDVSRFLSLVPSIRAGDVYVILFTPDGATVQADGRPIGSIAMRQFAEVMLATFLGPRPASLELKRDLLQRHG